MFKRVALFLALNLGIMLVLGVVAHAFGLTGATGRELNIPALLGFAALFGFGGAFISLLLSKPMAKWTTGAKRVDPSTSTGAWLSSVVERQATQLGITPPEVYVYESAEPNAFATGAFKNSAMVAFSTGLLRNMTKEEVEAVVGHELAHIANGDMVTMTLLQGVLNTFVIAIARVVGWVVDRMILKNEEEGPGMAQIVVTIVLEIALGFVAAIVLAWYSRRREFVADHGGASLTSRKAMANALRRLAGQHSEGLPANMAAMGMRSNNSVLKWFSTHPPIEERIQRLEEGAR